MISGQVVRAGRERTLARVRADIAYVASAIGRLEREVLLIGRAARSGAGGEAPPDCERRRLLLEDELHALRIALQIHHAEQDALRVPSQT